MVGNKITKVTSNPNQPETQPITITKTFEIIPGNRIFADMSLYLVFNFTSNLVVLENDLETPQIKELVWGFNLSEKDYRFKTLAVPCEFKESQGSYIKTGLDLDNLVEGTDYGLIFAGLEEPIKENVLTNLDRIKEELPGCREVWGELSFDSQNPEKLRLFFTEGDTSGFEIDEQGIVDLRKIMTLTEIAPIK